MLVIAATVYFAWRAEREVEQPPVPIRELLSEKNVALGYLESDKPDRTFDTWQNLTEVFPQQRLGPQNQVVACLLSIELAGGEPSAERVQAATAAMEKLQAIAPDSADTFSLLARVALAQGDMPAALDAWKRAGQLDPTGAANWFEAYLAVREQGNASDESQDDLLNKAAELAPDNLAIVLEQLPRLARQESPQLIEALDRAEGLLQPLEASVKRLVNISLNDLVSKARQAAEEQDWNAARRSIQMIVNATRAEEAVQSDRLSVDRSPLEFVVVDFSSEFYQKHADAMANTETPITVAYAAQPLTSLPEGETARDLQLADFDLSGTLGFAVLADQAVHLFLSDSATQRIETNGDFTHLLVADLDGDADIGDGKVRQAGDLDLIAYGPSGVLIVENATDADPAWQVVPQEASLADVDVAVLADLDHDGDLDLFASVAGEPTVWSNTDGLHFQPWADGAITGVQQSGKLTQAIAVDWDRDTDMDIVALDEGGRLGWFENLRHRRMRWHSFDKEWIGSEPLVAFEVVDVDRNASWDLLLGTNDDVRLTRTRTPQAGKVIPLDVARVADALPINWRLLDYDNDGHQDLFAGGDSASKLLRGHFDGKFVPTESVLPVLDESILTARAADIDDDGDMDLALLESDGWRVLENQGGNQNHWIDVRLLAAQVKGGAASPSGRVNQYGIGSLLEMRSGADYQALTVRDTTTHFGLGSSDAADAIRVIWTNGIPQSILQPTADTLVTERQTLKGSCPYLYAWDGERYMFVTDLLWAAPIGLQTPHGQIMPDRPWEYIKVPGHMVAEVDGQYRFRITEELWEAAYFDQVELIAVDHPSEVEVYTNEKVGPPTIAQRGLHLVGDKILPTVAIDSQGRDVRDLLAEQDDRYVKAFDRKIVQGWTEPHFIELEFDGLEDASQLNLFLTGWIYPTDTSINVGLAEDDSASGPRPPYIESLDSDGNWVETIPFTGFPGGKTKTVAIDISQAFAGDMHRLRIVTSNEIYWDAAFITREPAKAEVRETSLTMTSAELVFRGFSSTTEHPGLGPERYNYGEVSLLPKWPPMQGRFTRYGDVLPLLESTDSQLVVLGSGDEIALSFAPPAKPLPPGWTRDFVLHSVGWDKDADLNTIYGNTSEPLPFSGMPSYPSESYPSDPAYQEYLRTYQTRKQADGAFRNLLTAPPN